MFGHIEMPDAASFVGQYDEDIENAKGGGGDGEEINGDEVGEVIIEKGPPRLGWRFAGTNHILGNGCLRYIYIEFEQLSMNPQGSPQGIGPTHGSNEFAYRGIERGPPESLLAAFPGPIPPEALSVPPDDRLGGCTMRSVSDQSLQSRDSTIQNIRSDGLSCGRLADRFKTASC